MSVIVMGEFRLPAENLEAARPAMERVITLTRAEDGCLGYAYAPDLLDPCLIRIAEKWESAEALAAHLAMPHMDEWKRVREGFGLTGRSVTMYEIASERAV
ncbi:MAG: putative quinol monooxygenase [Novosphingobium sp.]